MNTKKYKRLSGSVASVKSDLFLDNNRSLEKAVAQSDKGLKGNR
jgi:hypothetical protein